MNITPFGNHSNSNEQLLDNSVNDFIVDGKHARMSQRKVAEICMVSNSSVHNWIDKLNNSELVETLTLKGFGVDALIDFLKYIVLDAKRVSEETKKHCTGILISMINVDSSRILFEEILKGYHTQFYSRPKDNILANSELVEDGSFVYLIKNLTTGNLKIGYSTNPCKRLIGLQQSTDCELKLLGFFEGTTLDEQTLLEKYSQYQIRGEWFRPAPEIYLQFGLTAEI